MGRFDRYNDGTQNPPRLQVRHSLWSLLKLPLNAPTEWTLDEKFFRVKESGFAGVECWLSEAEEQTHKGALDRHGLRLTLGHHPHTLEDVRRTVAQAVRLGADFVFAQPLTPYTPLSEAVPFLREAVQIGHDAGLPFFVETHRGNVPESLNQALELVERMPEIRFTGDFSHFVVVGEFYGWAEERAVERMRPILERTSHLHGRISNGEQVQVDVGDGSGDTAQFFVRLWEAAMRAWLSGAGPGTVPFASELGPPRYAITLPDGSEFSDRWQQSLVMKRLAEQAWAQAQQKTVAHNDPHFLFPFIAALFVAGVYVSLNSGTWVASLMNAAQQKMKGYAFSVKHQGRGGCIEYSDSKHRINLEIEMLNGKPLFVVYTRNIDDAFKPVLASRLQAWLKQSGRNWEVD